MKNIKQIFPYDLNHRKIIGIGIPFSGNGDAVFNYNTTTKNQIKSNLINYFLTNKGERIFNNNFGSNISKFLFEPNIESRLDNIKELIKDEIKIYFPHITIDKINIVSNPNKNFFQIIIEYNLDKFDIKDELILNFE